MFLNYFIGFMFLMFKANYLIRGMRLPAGQNRKFEMRFEPDNFYKGENYSRIASILVMLLFAAGFFLRFREGGMEEQEALADMESEAPAKKPVPEKAPVAERGKKK